MKRVSNEFEENMNMNRILLEKIARFLVCKSTFDIFCQNNYKVKKVFSLLC